MDQGVVRRWLFLTVLPMCAVVLAVPLLFVVGFATTATTSAAASPCQPGQVATVDPASVHLTADQTANAAIIVQTGLAMNVPTFGLVIAIATTRQESTLTNLAGGDRDSVGLFQQRPSAGWGTVAQLHDPATASRLFYTALLKVPGWQSLPLTVAAQAVQHSGLPDAYAQWQPMATVVVSKLTNGAAVGTCQQPISTTVSGKAGVAIAHAEKAIGSMYSFGGSCTDPQSTDTSLHCDCSSLVQQAWKAAGVTLPRTSELQYGAVKLIPGASPTNLASVPPGALLFYEMGEQIAGLPGHVALYIGGGRLVEASQSGQPVAIRPVYASTWVGAGTVR